MKSWNRPFYGIFNQNTSSWSQLVWPGAAPLAAVQRDKSWCCHVGPWAHCVNFKVHSLKMSKWRLSAESLLLAILPCLFLLRMIISKIIVEKLASKMSYSFFMHSVFAVILFSWPLSSFMLNVFWTQFLPQSKKCITGVF